MPEPRWFSVRAVYQHEPEPASVYEERILLFSAPDAEAAFRLAEAEADQYLKLNPTFVRVSQFAAFAVQKSVSNLNGAEVWSVLSQCSLKPADYIQRRYASFELNE